MRSEKPKPPGSRHLNFASNSSSNALAEEINLARLASRTTPSKPTTGTPCCCASRRPFAFVNQQMVRVQFFGQRNRRDPRCARKDLPSRDFAAAAMMKESRGAPPSERPVTCSPV